MPVCIIWINGITTQKKCDCLQINSQAPVIQKVDKAIHSINLYPLDSAIHRLNNQGQERNITPDQWWRHV